MTRAVATVPDSPRLVSAFPATGKSYIAQGTPGVIDSDSSAFSWVYPHPEVRDRHPDWPHNYVAHIRELLRATSVRLVLVSTHAEVRRALAAEDIPFTLVIPAVGLREEYRQRMLERGSPEPLVRKVIDELWDQALAECLVQEGCRRIVLGRGEYLADAVALTKIQGGPDA